MNNIVWTLFRHFFFFFMIQVNCFWWLSTFMSFFMPFNLIHSLIWSCTCIFTYDTREKEKEREREGDNGDEMMRMLKRKSKWWLHSIWGKSRKKKKKKTKANWGRESRRLEMSRKLSLFRWFVSRTFFSLFLSGQN